GEIEAHVELPAAQIGDILHCRPKVPDPDFASDERMGKKTATFASPRYSIVHCHIHLQGVTQWPAKPPPKLSKIKSRTKRSAN
ncbi:hypothetical protein, partial [Pseudomonas sp. HMWF011]|uniref:hypothetical protein n=1 Tax=Pseudomonas sp. HMWF011 TaxID=2056848 RepID=UPI001C464061